METIYTNEQLMRIIEKKSVGGKYPYNFEEFREDAVNKFMKQVFKAFRNIPKLEIEAEVDFFFGEGFSSYVEVVCTKKDGMIHTIEKDYEYGILVYLCRLAPVAVFGAYEHEIYPNGDETFSIITPNTLYTLPQGNWDRPLHEIKKVLKRFDFELLDKSYLLQPLPFDAEIPTIVEKPYKIFDAFFYSKAYEEDEI